MSCKKRYYKYDQNGRKYAVEDENRYQGAFDDEDTNHDADAVSLH